MKSLVTFLHTVNPAPVGGSVSQLYNVASTMAVGESREYVISQASWPSPGNRLAFFSYGGQIIWDAPRKQLIWYAKQASGFDGALHFFDDVTGLWRQDWRGWPSSDDGTGNNRQHPYFMWCLSRTGAEILITDYSAIRKWHGNSTLSWTLLFNHTSIAGWDNTNMDTQPHSLKTLDNCFPASAEGLLILTSQKLQACKRDGTSSRVVFTNPKSILANTGAVKGELHAWDGQPTKVVMVMPPAPKSADTFNNPDPRATACVQVYIIDANGSGTPYVTRIQDAPCSDLSVADGTGGIGLGDRIVCCGSTIYILEGNKTGGVWKFNATTQSWEKQAYTHRSQEAATAGNQLPVHVGGISALGLIVSMVHRDPAHSSTINLSPRMYLTKVA